MLVAQKFMIPMLQQITEPLVGQIDFDHPIEGVDAPAGERPCPGCDQPMETFGYMETNLAKAHRCTTCRAVWMDPEALTVVAVLYARTQVRRQAHADKQNEQEEALNRRVHLMLRARFASNALGRGFPG